MRIEEIGDSGTQSFIVGEFAGIHPTSCLRSTGTIWNITRRTLNRVATRAILKNKEFVCESHIGVLFD